MYFDRRDNTVSSTDSVESLVTSEDRSDLELKLSTLQCYNGLSSEIVWGLSSWGMRNSSVSNPFPSGILDEKGLQMLMAFDNGRMFTGDRSSMQDRYFPDFSADTQIPVLILTGGGDRQTPKVHLLDSISFKAHTAETLITVKENVEATNSLKAKDLPWTLLLLDKHSCGPKPVIRVVKDEA